MNSHFPQTCRYQYPFLLQKILSPHQGRDLHDSGCLFPDKYIVKFFICQVRSTKSIWIQQRFYLSQMNILGFLFLDFSSYSYSFLFKLPHLGTSFKLCCVQLLIKGALHPEQSFICLKLIPVPKFKVYNILLNL